MLSSESKSILDYHAPIRTIQLRKNCPYLCKETKELIKERNILLKKAALKNYPTLFNEFKSKAKAVKKVVDKDKKAGLSTGTGQ